MKHLFRIRYEKNREWAYNKIKSTETKLTDDEITRLSNIYAVKANTYQDESLLHKVLISKLNRLTQELRKINNEQTL